MTTSPTGPPAPLPRTDPLGLPDPPAGWFDFDASARRLGHYRWLELRAFEVVGGWVAAVGDPELQVLFATQSRHHAWHAELWAERLPRTAAHDPAALVAPAGRHHLAFVDALGEGAAGGSGDDLDGVDGVRYLVGASRVLLPRLAATYAQHRAAASAVADAPVVRALTLAGRDLLDDWRAGDAALTGRLRTATAVEAAARHQARLEALLVTGA